MAAHLFDDETEVKLYVKDDGLRTPVLRFPTGKYSGDLPELVVVRSLNSGRSLIAGTAWWGSPGMPPEADAVRVGPGGLRALEGPGEPSTGRYRPATVRRARFVDVARHQRGLGVPIGIAVITAIAAVAAAVAAFVTSTAPAGLGLLVLVLASLGAMAPAAKSIRDMVRAA